MTVKEQLEHGVAAVVDARAPRTEDKWRAVHCRVVERFFGTWHWAREWVLELCAADSQFLFHFADQPRGYVHFLCLLRLAESTPAVIELINDRFYGWRVGEVEIRKVDNEIIAIDRHRSILQSLSHAGFRKIPESILFSHEIRDHFVGVDYFDD